MNTLLNVIVRQYTIQEYLHDFHFLSGRQPNEFIFLSYKNIYFSPHITPPNRQIVCFYTLTLLSIYVFVRVTLSLFLSIYQTVNPSVYLPFYLSIYVYHMYLSIYLSIWPAVRTTGEE